MFDNHKPGLQDLSYLHCPRHAFVVRSFVIHDSIRDSIGFTICDLRFDPIHDS